MSNFKLYLEKAQGKNIDFKEIVSLNENFRNYMQNIYRIDEMNLLDFKVEGGKLKYSIYNGDETNAVKAPPTAAKYIELGSASDFLDNNNNLTDIGIKKIKDLVTTHNFDLSTYDLNSIGKMRKVNDIETEFKMIQGDNINSENAKKITLNMLKGGGCSLVSIVQHARGLWNKGGLEELKNKLTNLINKKYLSNNNNIYTFTNKKIDSKDKEILKTKTAAVKDDYQMLVNYMYDGVLGSNPEKVVPISTAA